MPAADDVNNFTPIRHGLAARAVTTSEFQATIAIYAAHCLAKVSFKEGRRTCGTERFWTVAQMTPLLDDPWSPAPQGLRPTRLQLLDEMDCG